METSDRVDVRRDKTARKRGFFGGGDHHPPTLISANTRVTGDIDCDGELQIDGTVEGNVSAAQLMIGGNGRVDGHITSEKLVIHGTVQGQIRADSVAVATTGRVSGDVMHRSLSIEVGAYLEGHCWHQDSAPPVEGSTADEAEGTGLAGPVPISVAG